MQNSTTNTDTPARPPLSAELMQQAATVERGMCFKLTEQGGISAAQTSDDNSVIVTWRGPEWRED